MSDTGKELLQAGGPGGYDIYVDPPALRRVAAAFDRHLARFTGAVGGFGAGASLPGNALGRLPEAHHGNQQYQAAHQAAVEALAEIEAVVRAVADGLRTNADVYDGADQPPA